MSARDVNYLKLIRSPPNNMMIIQDL